MDGLDRLTVQLYRSGLGLAAVALTAIAVLLAMADRLAGGDRMLTIAWLVFAAATGLSTHHLHIYDKRFRWFVGAVTWFGYFLMIVSSRVGPSAGHFLFCAGVGFLSVALSTFALKEQFCFKVPLQRLVPLSLIVGVFSHLAHVDHLAAAAYGVAAVCYIILITAKLRMPLHYDIGKKEAYQI